MARIKRKRKDDSWIVKAGEQIKKFTPKSGFNVVAVDDQELPGEALYLVAHYDDQKEAAQAARAYQAKSGDKTYVYPATK
jgi:hypothetical protein